MDKFDPFPTLVFRADPCHDGMRLDQFLRACMAWRSRASIRKALDAGRVDLHGRPAKPSRRVRTGDRVSVRAETRELPPFDPASVDVPCLYEDDSVAVFDKPAGLVVHPTGTYLNNTFMHVMVHRYAESLLPGGGPVLPSLAHRIDRNTSGVLLVTKDRAHRSVMQRQFENGVVHKAYRAIVHGVPAEDGFLVDLPIGYEKGAEIRIKRGIRHDSGAPARTRVEVLERFKRFALVEARPLTGRTHQIRVHLTAVGHPLAADNLYAEEEVLTRGDLLPGGGDEVVLARQALHACRLTIRHPATGEALTVEAPDPPDMAWVLALLREARDGD